MNSLLHYAIECLRAGTGPLWGVLAFRLLPFAGVVAIGPKRSWLARIVVVAAYAPISFMAATHGATPPLWLLLAYLYFIGAGWVAYELLPFARSKARWLAVVVALFWLFPAIGVHGGPAVFLTLGWDFTLAAYSYGIDTRGSVQRSLGDFLFFVLVNPALVYHNRGRGMLGYSLDARVLARVALGAVVLLISLGVLDPLRTLVLQRAASSAIWGTAAVAWLFPIGLVRFAREYLAQSGVASLQIGCMRLLGYQLPERYHWPMFARSPADFWRRWNTYVTGWARAYVFFPLVLAIPPKARRSQAATAVVYALAVLLTFAVMGFLHDGFVIAAEWEWKTDSTKWFLAMGGLVVVWEVFARVGQRASGRRLAAPLQHVLFLGALCLAAAFTP